MILSLPSASTFSGDIDRLVVLVTVLVGAWFVAAQIMFFWLMWRFRARPGHRVEAGAAGGREAHAGRRLAGPAGAGLRAQDAHRRGHSALRGLVARREPLS